MALEHPGECCASPCFLPSSFPRSPFAGGASAALRTGVADDLGRYPDQSVWFLDNLGELGMSENRITVNFDPAAPTTIPDQWQLDLYVPLATLRGVRPVFSVSPTRARAVAENPHAPELYAQYVALLARRYPTVKDFIIGNEPNQPRFWQPQFASSGQTSPPVRTTGCSPRPTIPSRLSTPRSE